MIRQTHLVQDSPKYQTESGEPGNKDENVRDERVHYLRILKPHEKASS